MNGLTTQQIKNIVHGKIPKSPRSRGAIIVKSNKPPACQRPSMTLDASFSSVSHAQECPTPDWFRSKTQPEVSIVIPMRNNLVSIKRLVSGWDLQTDYRSELVFVDDNCPMDSKTQVLQFWQSRKNDIRRPVGRIYWSNSTQGWTASCNIGAFYAQGRNIVFLDSSVLPSEGWLRLLLRTVRRHEIGVVSPVLTRQGRIFEAGNLWSWRSGQFWSKGAHLYQGILLPKPFKVDNSPSDLHELISVDVASAYCLCVRKSDFDEVGGFSPHIRSTTWGVADFCLRIKERGKAVMCQGNLKLEIQPAPEDRSSHEHGRSYFFNKWVTSGRITPFVQDKLVDSIPKVRSILIRRTASLGDVLLATGIAPALKIKYPDTKITFYTEFSDALKNNPWIDEVINEEDFSESGHDLFVDLDMTYEYNPRQSIIEAYADAAGVKISDCNFYIDQEPVDLPDDFIVIHAGKTLWAGRNWSAYKFDAIAKRIHELGYKLVAVGCETDHLPAFTHLDLRGKTSISQLAYVIAKAKLFIGIDSGPMHIAQIIDKPSVVFFGCVLPKTRLFRSCMHAVTASGIECLGCHHRKPTPSVCTSECEAGVQECINRTSVDQFWEVVEHSLRTIDI